MAHRLPEGPTGLFTPPAPTSPAAHAALAAGWAVIGFARMYLLMFLLMMWCLVPFTKVVGYAVNREVSGRGYAGSQSRKTSAITMSLVLTWRGLLADCRRVGHHLKGISA